MPPCPDLWGLDSELLAGYPMSTEAELPTTLKDFIRDYGAMEHLKSDNAKSETSFKMKDLFHMYIIKDKQSEPHYQHQNPIERHIQDLKRMMHGIMDHVGFPAPFLVVVSALHYPFVECSLQFEGMYSPHSGHGHPD